MVLALGFGAGCGDDSDEGGPSFDVAAACGRIVDAGCMKLVECKALSEGQAVTASLCAQARPASVEGCKAEIAHTTGTQADVDACVAGFQATACTDICGKVPADPAACKALGNDDPNASVINCAP